MAPIRSRVRETVEQGVSIAPYATAPQGRFEAIPERKRTAVRKRRALAKYLPHLLHKTAPATSLRAEFR